MSERTAGDALRAAGEARRPIYYGWWVLAAAALTEMLAIGSTSYAAGLFVLPLEREFSLSRAAASSALPISFAGAALMAPLVGYLLDKYPVQKVIAIGAIAFGLGFVIISATSSLIVMVLALLIPAAFGGMAIGPLTTATLTSRWFYRRRGRALGIATVATSGGGILVVPLLSWGIDTYGWRTALFGEALIIVLIVLALAAFVIRSGPAERELKTHPENQGRPQSDIATAFRRSTDGLVPHRRYGEILSTLNFWAVGWVLAAIAGIDQAIVVTIVPYATELGFTSAPTVFLITVFSVTAASVKLISGFLADYVDRRAIILAASLAMIMSLALLLWFSGYAMLLIACCLAGAGLGCILPASAALIAASFGAPSFGRAMGMIYVAVVVSSIVSVRFIGAVFDRTGNYSAAFLIFLAIAVISAAASLLVRTPQGVARKSGAAQAADLPAAESVNIVARGSPR